MPPILKDSSLWLAQRLDALAKAVAGLQAQRTLYYADAAGANVVIIGDISHDHAGNATGLSGTGIASHNTGSWVQVG